MNELLPLPRVCEMTTFSRTTVYRMIERGDFPRPVKLGLRRVAWRADEVAAWLESRKHTA